MKPKRSEKVEFRGTFCDALAARLDLPEGEPVAYALFAHCFSCSKDVFAAARVSAALTDHGFAVLRFDFTGLGSSDGEFANTNFSSNKEDLIRAVEYLRAHHQAPKILIGHSLGGAAVLAMAATVPEAVAVATIGAPCDPGHVAHLFDGQIDAIERDGEAEVDLGGRSFRIQKQFLDDIADQPMRAAIKDLRKALLIFHAPRDETVSIDNAGEIFGAALHPKSFISLDDANHLLTRRADGVYVAAVIAAWATKYLPDADRPIEAPTLQAVQGSVVVAETGAGKFTQAISVGGRFDLRADEPVSYGGNDTGPTPYDLLLAGLGACTSMTMRMYADFKGLPLDKVRVTLRHNKIHAEACEDCMSETGKVDRIERDVEIEGPDLSAADRAKLMEIADKCPVHKTLHNEVSVTTRHVT